MKRLERSIYTVLISVLLATGCAPSSEETVAPVQVPMLPQIAPTDVAEPVTPMTPAAEPPMVVADDEPIGEQPNTDQVCEVYRGVDVVASFIPPVRPPSDGCDRYYSGPTEDPQGSSLPLSISAEASSIGAWFNALYFDILDTVYADAEVVAANYAPVAGRSAWHVDLLFEYEDEPVVERHFVLSLDRGLLRVVANQSASDDWPATLAAFDELVASVEPRDFGEEYARVLPTQGGQCPIGYFWAFEAPATWFTHGCSSFNSSSEADLVMQCECWGPLWLDADPQPVERILAEFDDVTIISDTTGEHDLAAQRIVTFDGIVPETRTLAGNRSARIVVVDLASERLVIIANRDVDHVGPGHSWEDTLAQQQEIVASLHLVRELTPQREVQVCATGTRLVGQSDYQIAGDFDGDGFVDIFHAFRHGSYKSDPMVFHFEFGNGGYISNIVDLDSSIAVPTQGWQPNSVVRPAGLNRDALNVFMWAPDPEPSAHGVAQINGCEVVVTGAWGPSFFDGPELQHCWIATDEGEVLRTYLEDADWVADSDSLEFFDWAGETMTPTAPLLDSENCY